MMNFFLIVVISSISFNSFALDILEKDSNDSNKFEFQKQLDNAKEIEVSPESVGTNYLGEEIARKYYILQELYTYEEAGTPTSPATKTIVEKPSVYYSLKKLNRYYKKMVKKDKMEMDKAVEELKHFLNIGISIVYQPTEDFEAYLDDHRKPEEIVEAYSKVVLE